MTSRSPGRSEADAVAARWQDAAADLSAPQIIARTGASLAMVYRCRAGRLPNLAFLTRFAAEFGFCLDWLLTGRGPRRPDDAARWALETADLHDLCEALGAQAAQGDPGALRALADAFAPRPPQPQVVVRRPTAPPPRATPVRKP